MRMCSIGLHSSAKWWLEGGNKTLTQGGGGCDQAKPSNPRHVQNQRHRLAGEEYAVARPLHPPVQLEAFLPAKVGKKQSNAKLSTMLHGVTEICPGVMKSRGAGALLQGFT